MTNLTGRVIRAVSAAVGNDHPMADAVIETSSNRQEVTRDFMVLSESDASQFSKFAARSLWYECDDSGLRYL